MKLPYSLLFVLLFSCCSLFGEELVPDLTVMIPMRDGRELPTDFYLPDPQARHLPCILLRSPAGRKSHWVDFAKMAKDGYLVAIQETRSALDGEGKTFPFISDGWGKLQDGFDTVEWLAQCPYTNGKIGTWGTSALGITQLLLAPSQPPHLKCQYIMFAAASLYHQGIFPGGQLLKHQAESWLGYYARDTGVISYVSQRPFYNEFWKQLNCLEVNDKVQVPGLHVGGWYDTFLQGTLSAFQGRQNEGGEGAKNSQKLIIGPWTHFWPHSQQLGDFAIPAQGNTPPFDFSAKRWFDFYLKGLPNGFPDIPNVIYYVMGPFDGSPSKGNIWRTSDAWPVPATQTSLYLSPGFKLEKNSTTEGEAIYLYDPKHQIPTLGGRNLFLESGPKDQRSIENRQDILVFTSEKLDEDVEVTGPLAATLFFKSDREDTDVVVRLCDVYPDGRSILVSEGVCRLAIMNFGKETKDVLHELKIDLWATSMVFAKDHAIRLSVSSSNYPRYEKNMNVGLLGTHEGKKCQIATNKVLMGEKYPSRLILPIVK